MSEHGEHGARGDGGRGARDPEIQQTEKAEESSSSSRLFDIRQVIGGLFTLYGVLVTAAGVFDGSDASKKAAGIDINLWTGLGMLVLGLAMLLWMRLSPTSGAPTGGADDDGGDHAAHDHGSAGHRHAH